MKGTHAVNLLIKCNRNIVLCIFFFKVFKKYIELYDSEIINF